MSLLDLAKKTEAHFVAVESGAGSDIQYKLFSNNSIIETRAIVFYDDFRKLDEKKTTIADLASFMSVKLAETPQKKDKIILDSKEWSVVDFKPNGLGFYDIYCESSRRHTARNRSTSGRV